MPAPPPGLKAPTTPPAIAPTRPRTAAAPSRPPPRDTARAGGGRCGALGGGGRGRAGDAAGARPAPWRRFRAPAFVRSTLFSVRAARERACLFAGQEREEELSALRYQSLDQVCRRLDRGQGVERSAGPIVRGEGRGVST